MAGTSGISRAEAAQWLQSHPQLAHDPTLRQAVHAAKADVAPAELEAAVNAGQVQLHGDAGFTVVAEETKMPDGGRRPPRRVRPMSDAEAAAMLRDQPALANSLDVVRIADQNGDMSVLPHELATAVSQGRVSRAELMVIANGGDPIERALARAHGDEVPESPLAEPPAKAPSQHRRSRAGVQGHVHHHRRGDSEPDARVWGNADPGLGRTPGSAGLPNLDDDHKNKDRHYNDTAAAIGFINHGVKGYISGKLWGPFGNIW